MMKMMMRNAIDFRARVLSRFLKKRTKERTGD